MSIVKIACANDSLDVALFPNVVIADPGEVRLKTT